MKLLSRYFWIQYTFCAVIYLCLDLLWVSQIAKPMYINTLSPILSGQPAWIPALIFYLLYTFGLWFLAIRPSLKAEDAALRGAVVGLTAYGTYAFTGLTFFTGWTWSLTLIDCLWGMLLSAFVAYVTYRLCCGDNLEQRKTPKKSTL
jgi:uncharacterized membrane protein